MNVVSFAARPTRSYYRHQLHSLTYVTLDQANGGIVRNLNHAGVALQAVGRLRPQQRVRLRFELTSPRVRVETHGEVSWSTSSGQCGVRFVDLPARTRHEIDQWIFLNLLEAAERSAAYPRTVVEALVVSIAREEDARAEKPRPQNPRPQNPRPEDTREEITSEEDDGLVLSAPARPVILLQGSVSRRLNARVRHEDAAPDLHALDWLSRPLSVRTVARLVDSLALIAALLLFALIFLAITHELPPWPLTLGAVSAAVVFIATTYWLLFTVLGSASPGSRLARAANGLADEEKAEAGRRDDSSL
jgi:hypothetical protein